MKTIQVPPAKGKSFRTFDGDGWAVAEKPDNETPPRVHVATCCAVLATAKICGKPAMFLDAQRRGFVCADCHDGKAPPLPIKAPCSHSWRLAHYRQGVARKCVECDLLQALVKGEWKNVNVGGAS